LDERGTGHQSNLASIRRRDICFIDFDGNRSHDQLDREHQPESIFAADQNSLYAGEWAALHAHPPANL
jgi:hypothetical protein